MNRASVFRGWRVAALAPALTLAACTASNLDALKQQPVTGDGFSQKLARNYAGLADYEENQMYDSLSAQRFAGKGLAAARGGEVAPENPGDWRIGNRVMMSHLQEGRERLIKALAAGAATKAPAAAARAQVNYDCWVEQSSEGWQYADIATCRNGFMQAMNVVEGSMKPAQAAPQEPVASAPSNYIVFFDWDKATLRPEARSILRTAAENVRKSGAEATVVVGYADRSGAAPYNMGLSKRRAEAVNQALTGFGVDPGDIRTDARGEDDPLVPTADGVREPQNRRVTITLRGAEGVGAGAANTSGSATSSLQSSAAQ